MNSTDTTPNTGAKTKSIDDIMKQANRLMAVAKGNSKRVDFIRKTAFRYYDNIRACAVTFNYNDDTEYAKPYTRTQYINA